MITAPDEPGDRDAPPDDGAAAHARGSFFGRRKGHKLRIHQADLIDNLLPQRYLIQLVMRDSNGAVTVTPMTLDEANSGEMTVEVGSSPAYLVISGLTRFTTEPAPFHIQITD